MANQNPNITSTNNTFTKGLYTDLADPFVGEGLWTYARNAVNNSAEGQIGLLGNEQANRFCNYAPYPIIGAIYLGGEDWVIFSTDDIDSEIGKFNESNCTYTTIVNDRCLNFRRTNFVSAASRGNYDCTTSIYWDDRRNPTRVLNIDRVPYIEKPKKPLKANECYVPEFTDRLDCEALRLAPRLKTPCYSLAKSTSGGTLPNGAYQVIIAYSINGIKVTDYFLPSNVQTTFSHQDVSGAIEVTIEDIDTNVFDEFELVLLSYVKENLTARKIGYYSTRSKKIQIDKLDQQLTIIPIERIPIRTPSYEKSDDLYELNDYIIRIGIYTKPDLNYQLQANKIKTRWVSAEVPSNYYIKGGNITSYMRDEVYSFFIRWVYNTGEKSSSYHIPGREPEGNDISNATGRDAIENKVKPVTTPVKKWEVLDTSKTISKKIIPETNYTITQEGEMAYWESTERYPDDKPQIWGDLCGKPIRHHKFPDNPRTHVYNETTDSIVLLGVKFEGITHPLDNNGEPVPSIVGYEILRGSREGNKTIIAKGLLKNMSQYTIGEDISTRTGLYQNYPFNDLRTDPFLSQKSVKGGCQGKDYTPMGTFLNNVFSFHSPDTQFRDPFLNPFELKIHGEVYGNVEGSFSPAFKHPKHKLLRDFALFVAGIVGAGVGLASLKGKKTTTTNLVRAKPFNLGYSFSGNGVGISLSNPAPTIGLNSLAPNKGFTGGGTDVLTSQEGSVFAENAAMAKAAKTFTFTYFFGQATANAIKIIREMVGYEQFGYQYNAHGYYKSYKEPLENNTRRRVLDAQYINPYLQDFGQNYRINNLFRGRFVTVQVEEDLEVPTVKDDSRVTIGGLGQFKDPQKPFVRTTSAHYASLKIKSPSQYGQLDGIIQVPISNCVYNTLPDKNIKYASPVLFGGDVYINRYTEKNPFFFFNDWMLGEPNGYEYNYLEHVNVPFPRYWMDSREYDSDRIVQPFVKIAYGAVVGGAIAGGLAGLFDKKIADKKIYGINVLKWIQSIGAIVGGLASGAVSLQSFKNQVLPNDFYHLDRSKSDCTKQVTFSVKNAYFYLFANGVKDFYVESEINLAHRDWDDQTATRHYDQYSYTDLKSLFRSDIIKAGNFYKYDYSLSASRMLGNFISWGNLTPRDFDPEISETCYSYYANRAIYSLPQGDELKRDNWKIYLANNYYDFGNTVKSIKAVNQSGAIILYEDASPDFFAGVDQLQTGNGIKITIGDGGLFATPMQAASNAEAVYEYGSCQSASSVINTPAGLFWVSQNQGKVFQFANGIQEISNQGMKWWFAKFLPSQILKDYPDFQLTDNLLIGIGTTLTYDNTNEILYVCKKDYKVKDEYKDRLVYDKDNIFKLGTTRKVFLGDPNYFDNASVTVSYDTKTKMWVSFHDWHPDFILSSRKHFMTVKDRAIWKHNDRCDLFCNYYTSDYPFEVEYVASTGKEITTLKNVEYQLECYKYNKDTCHDKNHVLDFNFDRAIVHNSEQTSGNLKLVLKPKNDPITALDYPIIKTNNIDILFSKEENKYRFNQFWDVTRNRGEFKENYTTMWETESNGYIRNLRDTYLNYQKSPLQHKRIRHYLNKILLKRLKCDDIKMLVKLSSQNVTRSPR
jgi:hypothetical protein